MEFKVIQIAVVLATLFYDTYAGHASSYVHFPNFHGGYFDGGYYDDHYPVDYKYGYGVKDEHTHDHKGVWETRHGDQVKGQYWLYEPDGTKRIVDYVADKHHGFNAVVKKEGHAHHPYHYGHHGHHSFY